METVIIQPSEKSVWLDVVCTECEAVIVESLPSERAAYCRAREISEAMSKHICVAKVLAA